MINGIKRKSLVGILTLILSFILTALPIFAAEDTRVFDMASLFSDDDITKLETSINTLKNTYPLDVAIVTTNDTEGKSTQVYADDFYEQMGFGYNDTYDGLLLLIDMGSREIYISTEGTMISYFTDERISNILDDVAAYLSDGKNYEAADRFLRDVQKYMDEGIRSDQYSVEGDFVYSPNHEPHQPFTNRYGDPLTPMNIMISAGIAAIAALIIALIARAIVIHKYKNPRHTVPKTEPIRSSIHYSQREDRFVTSHTSRTRIQSNTSSTGGHSSGRSSVHHSSSGRSHGGGGRKF